MRKDRDWPILQGWKICVLRIGWWCGIPMSPLDVSPLQGPQKRANSGGIQLELRSKFHPHVRWKSIWNAQGKVTNIVKNNDVHLKNVLELVSTCLVLNNICIFLEDIFWKTEGLQEASDEVHNGLSLVTPPGLRVKRSLRWPTTFCTTLLELKKALEKHWSI